MQRSRVGSGSSLAADADFAGCCGLTSAGRRLTFAAASAG